MPGSDKAFHLATAHNLYTDIEYKNDTFQRFLLRLKESVENILYHSLILPKIHKSPFFLYIQSFWGSQILLDIEYIL